MGGGGRGAGKYAFLAFNASVASTMLELQKLCSITESEMISWEVPGMLFEMSICFSCPVSWAGLACPGQTIGPSGSVPGQRLPTARRVAYAHLWVGPRFASENDFGSISTKTSRRRSSLL